MNDWTDEDQPKWLNVLRRNLSAGMCPCPDCTADDGAQTTPLDPEEFN